MRLLSLYIRISLTTQLTGERFEFRRGEMDHKGVVPLMLMLGCFLIIVATVPPCAAAINYSLSGYHATDESVWNYGRTLLEDTQKPSMDTHDVEALLSFKRHIKSDPSGILSSWTANNSKEVCSWYGITCRPHTTKVVAIILPAPVDDYGEGRDGFQLEGTISPSLGNLPLLQTLNLSSNNFTGRIPPQFGQLKSLEILDLSFNYLVGGSIPKALCNCTRLKWIDLSANGLRGGIPTEFVLELIPTAHETGRQDSPRGSGKTCQRMGIPPRTGPTSYSRKGFRGGRESLEGG